MARAPSSSQGAQSEVARPGLQTIEFLLELAEGELDQLRAIELSTPELGAHAWHHAMMDLWFLETTPCFVIAIRRPFTWVP